MTRRLLWAALVAVALTCAPATPLSVVAPASAQTLPDLGDSSQVGFTPAQERKVGAAIIRQIRAHGPYLQRPEVNDYLNELGHRLVDQIAAES